MEQAIRHFIRQFGREAFETELRRVLDSEEDAPLQACGVERCAFPAEVQKILAEDAERTAGPVPDLVQRGGRYLVKQTGEIIFVSGACAVNLEVTDAINAFCREHRWDYEVLPAAEPQDPGTPLRVVFRTGFFVSPA